MNITDIIPSGAELTTSDKQKFLQLLLEQLNKDLAPHVTCGEFETEISPQALQNRAEIAIEKLWVHQYYHLSEVMYRIDLPEPILLEWLQLESNRSRISELTRVILRREAMKVWYRHFYQS
jgi:hypothetical protein